MDDKKNPIGIKTIGWDDVKDRVNNGTLNYFVIEWGTVVESFMLDCNKAVKAGAVPVGGVCVSQTKPNVTYSQAFIKLRATPADPA